MNPFGLLRVQSSHFISCVPAQSDTLRCAVVDGCSGGRTTYPRLSRSFQFLLMGLATAPDCALLGADQFVNAIGVSELVGSHGNIFGVGIYEVWSVDLGGADRPPHASPRSSIPVEPCHAQVFKDRSRCRACCHASHKVPGSDSVSIPKRETARTRTVLTVSSAQCSR